MQRKRVAILSSYFRLGQYRGIMRYGQQAGWICQRMDRDTLSRLNLWKPDGLLYQIDEFDAPLLNFVRDNNLPKVGLRALRGADDTTPLVLTDLAAMGERIANHFVARNYRRFCYLGPSSDETANAGSTHVAGMRRVADARGIRLECVFPDQADTWKGLGLTYQPRKSNHWDRFWELGFAVISHLMRNPEPVAVFCAFAEPAMQFMEMVDDRKIAIPYQIGIAAQTDDALNGLVTKVPMTCLVPDFEGQGFEAAALLDRMLDGGHIAETHRRFIPEAEFVPRKSTGEVLTGDSTLDEMLLHIRRNALENTYCPQKLANSCSCSLRFIQARFRKAIGRGVAEIIREHRTRHASELIRKSNMPLRQVVKECGFSGYHQLERAVSALCGMLPSEMRKHHHHVE